MLTIGELSRATGVKIPTIRYYEQMGLMAVAERSGATSGDMNHMIESACRLSSMLGIWGSQSRPSGNSWN